MEREKEKEKIKERKKKKEKRKRRNRKRKPSLCKQHGPAAVIQQQIQSKFFTALGESCQEAKLCTDNNFRKATFVVFSIISNRD